MKSWKWVVFGAFLASAAFVAVGLQRTVAAQKGEGAGSDAYEAVPNWPQPVHPDGSLTWGRIGAVYAESPNRIYLFQTGEVPPGWLNEKDPDAPNFPRRGSQSASRCEAGGPSKAAGDVEPACYKGKPIPGSRWEHIVMVVDGNGKLIESWEQHNNMFGHPHGININPYDPERHVWLTDDAKEQIFKFTHDGKKLVMTVGDYREGGREAHTKGLHKGNDEGHLGGPNGMAFLPNGDFWVSDGYVNSRVVKFSKDGKFLMQIGGKKGGKPGEFNTTHSVEVLPDGRIFVGDRGNYRIQIFDKDGKYLQEIHAVYPNALALSKDGRFLYVAQGGPNAASEIRRYTVDGVLVSSFGRPYGTNPGQLWGVHDFSRDSDGNMYFSQSWGGGAWKYRPKKGADPTFLFSAFAKTSLQSSKSH